MKKLTMTLILSLTMVLAFGQKNEDLYQRWKVDMEAVVKELPPEVTKMLDMVPADQKEVMKQQMLAAFEQIQVEFKKDGTMVAQDEKGPTSGTWKFMDNETALWTKVNEEESILDILELTESKLRFKQRVENESQPEIILTLIPY